MLSILETVVQQPIVQNQPAQQQQQQVPVQQPIMVQQPQQQAVQYQMVPAQQPQQQMVMMQPQQQFVPVQQLQQQMVQQQNQISQQQPQQVNGQQTMPDQQQQEVAKKKSNKQFSDLARKVAIGGGILGAAGLLHKIHHDGGLFGDMAGTLAVGAGEDNESGGASVGSQPAEQPDPEPKQHVRAAAPMEGPPSPRYESPNQRLGGEVQQRYYGAHIPQPGGRLILSKPFYNIYPGRLFMGRFG